MITKVTGAIFCGPLSQFIIDGNSNVKFNNNEAIVFGGAIYCLGLSNF